MTTREAAEKLCRIIAALNYDGQRTSIVPELFAKPNFTLVCDLLKWFGRIVADDASFAFHDETSRVAFLISMGRLFCSQLGVRLNLVALYRADGASCLELLKIAEPIYEAARLTVDGESGHTSKRTVTTEKHVQEEIEQTLEQLNQYGSGLKELSSTICHLANGLDNLLGDEEKFNAERLKVMDRRLELAEIEKLLRDARDGIVEKTMELSRANQGLEKDLVHLDERLATKELEINEAKDRLNDLLVQSPAYVERYEKLHIEYEAEYGAYVSKYRNLNYLKSCVYPTGGGGDDEILEIDAAVSPTLLDGTSKSISAALTVDENGAAATAIGPSRAGEVGGIRRTAPGSRLAPPDTTGLELEGLLNEFVADSTEVHDDELDGNDEDDNDEVDGDDTDATEDEVESSDEDDDDNEEARGGAY